MKRLLLLLTLCVGTLTAMAVSYTIKTTAQPTTSNVQTVIGEPNFIDVTSLTFLPGSTINSYDIMIIRNRMINLTYLDMREVTIVANDHEYYTGYHSENNVLGPYAFYQVTNLETVILPKSITSIGWNAFGECAGYIYGDMAEILGYLGLKTVVFPAGSRITRIGNSAFESCFNLKKVEFENGARVDTIGNGSFRSCNSLSDINFPEGLKKIEGGAFSSCSSLGKLVLPPSLINIGDGAFNGCYNLKTVKFRDRPNSQLDAIEYSAFGGCSSLTTIKLPPLLSRIEGNAFSWCSNLPKINIPSGNLVIGPYAFNGCNNLNMICPETACPISIDQTTFSTYETANIFFNPLIIPFVTINDFYWNTEWNQFLNLHPKSRGIGTRADGDEEEEEDDGIASINVYFYLPKKKDYLLAENDIRIAGSPNADFYSGSGLIVEGDKIQSLGKVNFKGSISSVGYMGPDNYPSTFSSIIGNGNISINKLYFDLRLESYRWHFISFPFKVRRSDIICDGNYVFRYYDSENRAQNGTTGWKDIPDNEEFLYPGRGYIFQTDYTPPLMTAYEYEPAPTIRIPVDAENLDFSGANKSNTINSYPSSNASNASWNFMGNPYPSYFDLDEVLYEGPITVWNGNGYECVKKGDDVYHFRPLEGFFIQKPENMNTVVFQAGGRHTYSQWAKIQEGKTAATRAAEASSRQLINLTISDGSYIDKTRVVFNPECADSYEIGTDATKFIAANVAQLYTIDNKEVQYAINERPAGEVHLGYVAAKGGEMTISASRMDTPIALYDKQMDVVFDLNKGSYTFATEAGTFNDRFLLVRDGQMTRIDAIHAEDAADAPVYSLDGRRVEQMKTNRVYITEGKKVIKK